MPQQYDIAARDPYGFEISFDSFTKEDYSQFYETYSPLQAVLRHDWQVAVERAQEKRLALPLKSDAIKQLVRRGIPAEMRGSCWFYYSGAEEHYRQQPALFREYMVRIELARAKHQKLNEYDDVIERDLHRTFPEHYLFRAEFDGANMTQEPETLSQLRRVLQACTLHLPEIGYCQGLNFIAGFCLLFLDETRAFWLLVTMIRDLLPEGTYGRTLQGTTIDQDVFGTLLQRTLPKLAAMWNDVPVSVVTCHWFLTLFINITPVETTLRIWDSFMYEGNKVLFRVAIALFKLHEKELMACRDTVERIELIKRRAASELDCERLMDTAFYRIGSLSKKYLESQRSVVKRRMDQEKS